MLEKIKKPKIMLIVVAVISLLIFTCGDLYYHFCLINSTVGYVLFGLLISALFAILLVGACATRKASKKKTLSFTLPLCIVLLVWLTAIPPTLRAIAFSAYKTAQIVIYTAFGLEMIGFVLFFILLLKKIRFDLLIFVSSILLAFSVTAISCWTALDRSVTDYAPHYDWELDAPSYDGGKLSRAYNCGIMQKDEYHGLSGEETYMQVISRTDKKAFEKYCKKVEESGYVRTDDSSIEAITSATFKKDGKILHVYYNAKQKTVRVISDVVSVTPKEFSYTYVTQPGEKTSIYQYALMYDDNCGSDYTFGGGIERCGMNYIIKLADNKLILIDGGSDWQCSDAALEGFFNLCKEITGSDHLDIACWLCTHGHSDHISFFNKFLRLYHDDITLERFMYNFPSYHEIGNSISTSASYTLYRRLETYAPNALILKPHTGETFTLGNVKTEILYTHEDAFDYRSNRSMITDFNDSSTTYRFTIDGNRTFMLVGDMNKVAHETVADTYTAKTLKSDIIQAAHHGYNSLDRLYPLFGAEYAFFPQGTDNALGENYGAHRNYEYVAKFTDKSKIYFCDKFTYGLSVDSQGNIIEEEKRPYIGPDYTVGEYYDGSAI